MFASSKENRKIFEAVEAIQGMVNVFAIFISILLIVGKLLAIVSLSWQVISAITLVSIFSRVVFGLSFAICCFAFAAVIFVLGLIVSIFEKKPKDEFLSLISKESNK